MGLEPRNLVNKYNTDDVHSRVIIAGVINFLQSKIFITNILDNNTKETIPVPFLYGMSTDERFMQDYFIHFNDCIHPKIADGNYDIIPRGHIVLKSKTTEPEKMTQRFQRAVYYKEKDGKLIKYSSYVYLIPIVLNFDVEIKCDTLLNCFKIEQELYKAFYKVFSFSVNYEHFRLPCYIGFPDEFNREENLEYSYSETNQVSLKFEIQVETYFPIIDLQTEMEAAKSIHTFDMIENVSFDWSVNKQIETINFLNISNGDIFYPGSDYQVQFEYTGNINYIDLIITDSSNNIVFKVERQFIGLPLYFNIPFDDSKQKVVIYDSVTPVKPAKIFIKTDGNGQVIDYVILDGGFGYSNDCSLDFVKSSGTYTPAILTPILNSSGSIISINIDNPGSGYYPTIQIPYNIKIQDTLTNDVFDLKNIFSFSY